MPKVLVVDDSLSVRKVVERALASRQIDVVSAASGGEALERIEREAPDIVICDVVMPDRDGYEICAFVKNHARLAAIPVLLMSGIVNDEVRARAEAARSVGVLAKPFAAEDLLRYVDTLLANGTAAAAVTPGPAEPARPVRPPLEIRVEPPPGAPGPVIAPATPAPLGLRTDPAPIERRVEIPAASRVPVIGPPAPSPFATPPAPPIPAGPAGAEGVKTVLEGFRRMDGVQWAILTDREGFVIESTSDASLDGNVAAALSACLAESTAGLGRELARGALIGMILE